MNISVKAIDDSWPQYASEKVNSTGDSRNENLAQVELAVLSTIFILAVFGNSVVLVTLIWRWKKLTRMQVFIVHLSAADLFVAFCHVLPQLLWDFTYRFRGNDGSCKFVKLVQIVAVYASSYVLVLTAIDRYNAICRPLSSHLWTTRRVHVMVILAWLASVVFSLPQIFLFSYQEVETGSNVYDCWATFEPLWILPVYVTWFTTSVFFVPVIILIVTYGFVCYHVWIRTRVIQSNSLGSQNSCVFPHCVSPQTRRHPPAIPQHTMNLFSLEGGSQFNIRQKSGLSKSKIRTFKLTFTVILCFIFCWSPFFISQLWWAYDQTAPFDGAAMTIMVLLASLNSCTNPWIYLAFSKTFCIKLKRSLSSRRVRLSSANPSLGRTNISSSLNTNGVHTVFK